VAALQRLGEAPWPGNVRELRNVVDRLRIHWQHRPGDLSVAQMLQWVPELDGLPRAPAPARVDTPPSGVGAAAARPDAVTLQQVLAACGGNREQACAQLGVSRTTLWRWLRAAAIV
jgi:propionate catabolism operon transcriptional regulator